MAKLSKAEWADARKVWELDARDGHQWLADHLVSRGFDVNRVAIAKAAKRQGWKKITQGEKVTKTEKKSLKKVTEQKPKMVSHEYIDEGDEPSKPGRPSLYKQEYEDQVYKLCLLGATDAEVADFFNVTERTVNSWKISHQEFLHSMSRGKIISDADIAESLYNRAIGYSHPETKVFNNSGEIIEHEVMKHYPPDTTAIKLWLLNRRPKQWKNQPETVAEINFNVVPQAELDRIHAVNLEKQKELMATVMGRAARLGIVTSYIDSSATRETEDE